MPSKLVGLLAALLVLGLSDAALAQYSVPSQASRGKSDSNDDSSRAKTVELAYGESKVYVAKDDDIPWEVGASLNFFTSEESLGGEKLAFTDLMLLRLHGLIVLGDYEVFLGNDILPKQPSYTDELVWQGSLAGVRTAIGDKAAAWLRGQIGPQLDREGYWFSVDAAAQYHYALQDILFFESSLGWSHSQLKFKREAEQLFYVDEIFTKVGLALRDPRRHEFGVWVNFDYYYPILGGPDRSPPDPVRMTGLDPQPRVNMHLGALGAITDNVDLFVEYSILDRGDLEDSPTTLPILNGGFDQREIVFGFMRHFGD